MNWLSRLFGKTPRLADSETESPPVQAAVANTAAPGVDDRNEHEAQVQAVLDATARRRDACYASLGAMDGDVLAPLVNPSFSGGPRWPALRQAWRVVRRPGSTLVASDALSDPFDEHDEPPVPLGFGLEVYAEARGVIDDVAKSWLFDLTYQVSQNVADHGRMRELLERYEVLSMLLPIEGLPADWVGEQGQVAFLIGVPATSVPARFDTEYGDVRLAAITLLRPDELQFLERDGDIAGNRKKLAALLAALPEGHVNDFSRPSVVPA
ncbi:hypothetical protein ACILG0_08850 [Pseudomonadota bacterium AL_CKDN230030165-1A_HGKHYDSX7]